MGKGNGDSLGVGIGNWQLAVAVVNDGVTATNCAVTSRLVLVTCHVESSLRCGC